MNGLSVKFSVQRASIDGFIINRLGHRKYNLDPLKFFLRELQRVFVFAFQS